MKEYKYMYSHNTYVCVNTTNQLSFCNLRYRTLNLLSYKFLWHDQDTWNLISHWGNKGIVIRLRKQWTWQNMKEALFKINIGVEL